VVTRRSSTQWFLILAGAAFVLSYFQVQLQMAVSQRTGHRLRMLYFNSLMRQDFNWYDSENSGELTSRVASDVNLIQAGIGDKVGSAIQFLSSGFVGFVIAFFYSWKLTFVILSVTPILAICGAVFAQLTADSVGEGQGAYGDAGAVASEVLSLVKTVSAFGGQEEEVRRYEKNLDSAYKSGAKKGIASGLGMGITMCLVFCIYGCVMCLSFDLSPLSCDFDSNLRVLIVYRGFLILCSLLQARLLVWSPSRA
jgi:ABC-type multidrug transport system fused ATPase/permease subunit